LAGAWCCLLAGLPLLEGIGRCCHPGLPGYQGAYAGQGGLPGAGVACPVPGWPARCQDGVQDRAACPGLL
jgi:hypothetical protein